jgi:hypothetical protein
LVAISSGYNAARRSYGRIAKKILDRHIGWLNWRRRRA